MAAPGEPIQHISDTAFWAAAFRARETERPNALFRDPFAARLAAERGPDVIESFPNGAQNEWAWISRTVLFDRLINEEIASGVDLVLNLAAGLDARPYRLELPSELRWIEADLPPVLEYKSNLLKGDRPRCHLERVAVDLADDAARRTLFSRVAGECQNGLIITEGLLIYLQPAAVETLASDLAATPGFRVWVTDLATPALLRILQKHIGGPLARAGAPLRFAPDQGPRFFERFGWSVADANSMLKAAARLGRLRLWLRLLAMLPDTGGRNPRQPWSGVCRLRRAAGAV